MFPKLVLCLVCYSCATNEPQSESRKPASEVDSFTQRYDTLKDSTDRINILTNEFIQHGIDKANQKDSCNNLSLYKSINKVTAGIGWSKLEIAIEEDDEIEKRKARQNRLKQIVWLPRDVGGNLKCTTLKTVCFWIL